MYGDVVTICGPATRAITAHIKQPRGPHVIRRPRIGQPWPKRQH